MKKYVVETYYTCTFKTVHTLDNLDDAELSKIDARTDGDVEVIDVKLNNRKTKKVGGKIELIHHLIEKADTILIGGAMAFTFLKVQGKNIGASLVDDENFAVAEEILSRANDKNVKIELPVDVVCATGMADDTPWRVANLEEMESDEMGFDIGPETTMIFLNYLYYSKHLHILLARHQE